MKWEKIGQIFKTKNNNEYLVSHASNPLPIHLKDNIFRVFYSGRNKNNKSSVGFVDIDIVDNKVINYPSTPLIKYGSPNSFYSHGISIGNLYEGPSNNKYILFMAWQIRGLKHWRGDIGRLELIENNKLIIDPNESFMCSDKEDPVSLSYPFVIFHDNIYKMWYGSTIDWSSKNGEMIHVIKYATSKDGETWDKKGIAIPYEIGLAQAFSRPSVIIDENGYHMWFSYRDGSEKKYRIGYSHSLDGKLWKNKLDSVGIDVSISGWDSEMICYPFVFDHNGERIMLYNGNSHGKEGFGLAKLVEN